MMEETNKNSVLGITLEEAIETYKFGFDITYDVDSHIILYGTKCNRCGEYFTGKKIDVYCDKCKNIYNN